MKNKFILNLIITLVLAFLLLQMTPWWSMAIIAGLVAAVIHPNGPQSFFSGFLGIGLAWGISAFMINSQNDSILASQLGDLFGGVGPIALILITAIVGSLLGGFGALTGSLARGIFSS